MDFDELRKYRKKWQKLESSLESEIRDGLRLTEFALEDICEQDGSGGV